MRDESQELTPRSLSVVPNRLLACSDLFYLPKFCLKIDYQYFIFFPFLGVVDERVVEVRPLVVVGEGHEIAQSAKQPNNCLHTMLLVRSNKHNRMLMWPLSTRNQ